MLLAAVGARTQMSLGKAFPEPTEGSAWLSVPLQKIEAAKWNEGSTLFLKPLLFPELFG